MRLRRLAWLLAGTVVLASCHPYAAHRQSSAPLRVMTYNIQAGGGHLDSIASVIRAADADIVALQEVDVHWQARSAFADQAADLARALGMSVRFAPIYVLPGNPTANPAREYGVALLSRYPIVGFTNHEITRLSTQTEQVAPTLMPGFLEAVVDVHGARVRVFNTHLDYRGDPAVRRAQVAESLRIIGDATSPVLMFGDFNASPAATELRPLLERLHDAWRDVPDPGFTYPAIRPVRRIDYVLTSPHFRVLDARVLDTQASDHRPVVVSLRFVSLP